MGLLMGNRGQVLVLLIVLGVLISAVYLFVIPVKANPLTQVTLELPEEPLTVDVSPGSDGIVEVNGMVTCRKVGPDLVKVYLTGSSDFGPAPVVPSNFVFSGASGTQSTETFTVTTRVPMGHTSSASPVLTVSGYFDQGGLRNEIEPKSVSIIILQYYLIKPSKTTFVLRVDSGENVDVDLTLSNEGNGDDIFLIDFINRDKLEDKGFELPDNIEISMPEKTNKSIILKYGASKEVTGTYASQIIISSKGSEQSGSPVKIPINVYLKVGGPGIMGNVVSYFISPFMLFAAVMVIVIVLILRTKKKREVSSNVHI